MGNSILPDSQPSSHSSQSAVQTAERRKSPRRKPRQLVYIDIGENNGGFVLDVSEGGVCFQGMMSLSDGETVKLRFKLPGTDVSIRAEGQFIRPGNSEKGGVLKFLNLPPELKLQLREWIATGGDRPGDGSDEVLAALSRKPQGEVSRETDGAVRFSSVLAKALAKSEESVLPNVHPAQNSSVEPPADRKPPAEAVLPAAIEQTKGEVPEPVLEAHSEQIIEEPKTPSFSELKVSQRSQAANDTMKSVRDAVLTGSGHYDPAPKGKSASQFAAGIVVGFVVLVAVGGGLVATGRLRLVRSTPAVAASAAVPAGNSSAATASPDAGNSQGQAPASADGAATASTAPQPSPTLAPPAPQSQTPAAAAAPTSSAIPAASSAASSRSDTSLSPVKQAQPRQERAATESVRPSETRQAEVSTPLPLTLSRPVSAATSAPASSARANIPAPTLSSPSQGTQALPELGEHSAAAISQTSTPAIAQPSPASPISLGAFASPVPEAAHTTKTKVSTVSQSSKPVFASPDSSSAKPSAIEPAMLVLYVEPTYPASAKASNVQGDVSILATIGKDGVPRDLRATSGDPQLAAAAITAVSNWRYRPAILDGQFEESLITITVKFSL